MKNIHHSFTGLSKVFRYIFAILGNYWKYLFYVSMPLSHGVNPYYSVFRSPIGDFLGLFGSGQADVRCRELELNVLDCTDVYGHKGITKQCRDLYEDFSECIYRSKQMLRAHEMIKERMRQYYAGERSKENLYAKPPPLDAHFYSYLKDID